MTLAIPASQLVKVNPGVVGAAGQGIVLNGLCLTTSPRVPIGTTASFTSAAAVAAFFGNNSPEAVIAAQYFLGFANSTIVPGALLFTQYAWSAPVAAYLQSGPVSNLSLAQLQAISGTLIVTIDGETFTSSTFNLAPATSFSTAAAIIQTALAAIEAVITGTIAPAIGITDGTSTIALNVMTVNAMASGHIVPGAVLTGTGVTAGTTVLQQLTGTSGGAGTYQVSVAQTVAATAITATNANAGVLDATAVSSGVLAVGQNVQGGSVAAGTIITGELTGTGGTGFYVVSPSQTVGSESMNCGVAEITYDSVSGSFFITGGNAGANGSIGYGSGTAAAALNFTQANGAILEPGVGGRYARILHGRRHQRDDELVHLLHHLRPHRVGQGGVRAVGQRPGHQLPIPHDQRGVGVDHGQLCLNRVGSGPDGRLRRDPTCLRSRTARPTTTSRPPPSPDSSRR